MAAVHRRRLRLLVLQERDEGTKEALEKLGKGRGEQPVRSEVEQLCEEAKLSGFGARWKEEEQEALLLADGVVLLHDDHVLNAAVGRFSVRFCRWFWERERNHTAVALCNNESRRCIAMQRGPRCWCY